MQSKYLKQWISQAGDDERSGLSGEQIHYQNARRLVLAS
jgi:hypothetical protein